MSEPIRLHERTEPDHHQAAALGVEAILTSPSTSTWLREALQAALQRDPVDAANDAELLAAVLANRCATQMSLRKSPGRA